MAAMEEERVLLDSAEQAPALAPLRKRWWWPLTVVGVVLVATALEVLALRSGRPTNEIAVGGVQGLSAAYTATATCYGFTGGTCSVTGSCDAGRNAVCRKDLGLSVKSKCICEGGCVSPSGICNSAVTNTLVATMFTLTNMKFSSYTLYFQSLTVLGQLKVTRALSALNFGKDKLALYRFPNSSKFLVNSVAFPGEVAQLAKTGVTAFTKWGAYAVDLTAGKAPGEIAFTVCWNSEKSAMMFGDAKGQVWAYAKRLTWYVYGYEGSKSVVGDAGLWKPYPMLTPQQIAMLSAC